MGFADSLTGRLFALRRKTDIEFQIQVIMERKLAIIDECNELSANMSNSIFQTSEHSSLVGGTVGALPGFIGSGAGYPAVGTNPIPQNPIATGTYEQRLADLQAKEKELDIRQKKMETELEAVKAEEESMKKIANDHAKKDFKVG